MESRIAHVESLLRSSCFNARVIFEGRALQWDAAAAVLSEKRDQLRAAAGGKVPVALKRLQERIDHCKAQAADFRRQASAYGPLDVYRDDKQTTTHTQAHKSGKVEPNQQKAAIHFVESALEEAVPAFKAAGLKGGLKPKHLFKAALNEILSKRPSPRVSNPLYLPVAPEKPSTSGTAPDAKSAQDTMVLCVQTPARALSASMKASYQRDGLQGVLCHDDTEHRHASNLYRSELRDEKAAGSMLTLTRHGSLSAFGLTRDGIATISDERLGLIVRDFGYDWQDPAPSGTVSRGGDLASLGRDFRRRAESRGGDDLLAHMRATASQKRAMEVADAAVSALPADELARIRGEISAGKTPTVRLTSVSLLTPDSVRGHDPRSGKYTAHERLMWTDQLQAWKAVEGLPKGVPCRSLQGDGQETAPLVKFEIAAFDVPVNAGGVSQVDAFSGHDFLARTNRDAVERLVGKLPDARRLKDWEPTGWVGDALKRMDPSDPNRQAVLTLAKQVAQLMVKGQHQRRGDDPYILVRRLLVLSQLTGQVAPLVNCRSGKDRTSEAEAQARQLAFHIATTGKVPALDEQGREIRTKVETDLRAQQLWAIHRGGGASEIQGWNTTYRGTKLEMPGLTEQYQMHAPELLAEYLGQSKAAKD